MDIQQVTVGSPVYGERTPYPGSFSAKNEGANIMNIFGNNVHTDNMDYINSMLKTQFTDNMQPMPKAQRKKRYNTDAKDQPVLSVALRQSEEAQSPPKIDDALGAPSNSPNREAESSVLTPEEPVLNEKYDGNNRLSAPEEPVVEKIKCVRNSSNTVMRKDEEMYEDFFQSEVNDYVKRSMSVEDIKIPKRDFLKTGSIANKGLFSPVGRNIYVSTRE